MANSVPFDGHFNVYSTLFNAMWDFDHCELFSQSPFGLYVGGGIGFAKQNGEFDVNGNFFELKDWGFAYQALLGLTFWEGRRGSLYAEYRYMAMTETELKENDVFFDNFTFESQNIVFGIRIKR